MASSLAGAVNGLGAALADAAHHFGGEAMGTRPWLRLIPPGIGPHEAGGATNTPHPS